MRILLIDDSSAYHEEFRSLLEGSGIAFSALDAAFGAAEGSRAIAAGQHDLYVIDYRLPDDSGLELVRQIRGSEFTRPVIMLTGYEHPDIDHAAERAGANDFLRKGDFTAAALGRSIRYAVSNAAAVREARDAEARFVMAQEAADIGVWEWNIGNNSFVWSERQYRNFGFDPATKGPIGYDTWRSAIHPEDRDAVAAAMTAALAGRTRLDVKFRVMIGAEDKPEAARPVHWLSASGRVTRNGLGNPTHMVGVTIDVTEQLSALQAARDGRNYALSSLHASQQRFRAYFDNAPECLFYLRRTDEGNFVYEAINPAGLAHLGLALEEVCGRTPEELLGAEVGKVIAAGIRRVYETGNPFLYEPTFPTPSGMTTFDSIYMPFYDGNGVMSGVFGSARDVTERRRLEASLRQAQKMEALGELASGVAHDFNNLLTGMLGALEMVARHVTSERGVSWLREGRKTVERGKALTSRLLAFSRKQPLTTAAVNLNASIEQMTTVLGRTLGNVRVGLALQPDLWPAMADSNQIELAMLNIAINARDAMPLGGSLTVTTRNDSFATPQEDGLAPGHYVTVTLTDTGTGMPPEVLARAMDPFFTTKDPGRGTGLGLSMVYGMMRQLGGGVRIASELGHGTSVTLLCPRAEPAGEPAANNVERHAAGLAAILLVDDDPDTQAAVSAYAGELGIPIMCASSSNEALALLRSGCEAAIIVADQTLPGLSGPALLAEAQVLCPSIAGMLISGQPGSGVDAHPLLEKPFGREEFSRAVIQLLSQANAAIGTLGSHPDRPVQA